MKLLIRVAGLAFVTFAFVQSGSVRAGDEQPQLLGECYMTFNCIGASIGIFTDNQCRAMGGHSMNQGGVCWEL